MIPRPMPGQNVFPLATTSATRPARWSSRSPSRCMRSSSPATVAGATALVLGLGTIGLQVVQALRARGAGRVIGVDLSELRLEAARTLGAEALDGAQGLERRSPAARSRTATRSTSCSSAPACRRWPTRRSTVCGPAARSSCSRCSTIPSPSTRRCSCRRRSASRAASPTRARTSPTPSRCSARGKAQSEPLITHRESLDDIGDAFVVQLREGPLDQGARAARRSVTASATASRAPSAATGQPFGCRRAPRRSSSCATARRPTRCPARPSR